ncbi:transposase [Streptomyces calvus]|uniref:transposase n=1 Tax=Streptomyces sp. SID7804 TaxID=2690327 RepID=UPI00136DA4C7|nr:transposase [Streptomyces calvus]
MPGWNLSCCRQAEGLTLESWAERRSTAQGRAVRARTVPACANGWNNTVVAARLGVGTDTVRRRRTRFLARRPDGLADEPRPGDRQTDPGPAVHVICDNLSAHEAPVVHTWLLAHPRFQLHFTPTCSSWINQVERWFAEPERRCLTRGVFCSLDDLKTALEEWIKVWNDDAGPFEWTKTADRILDRICHYCDRISEPDHWACSASAVQNWAS